MSGDTPMNTATARIKLTYDDLLLFPEDGKRHELIDGEHYVSPSPNTAHQQIAGNLHWLLRSYLENQPRGQLFFAPFDIVFTQFDVVEPDLLYMSHERASEILTDANVQGCPELVVEIGSKSTRARDESIKLRLYERAGVSEYWVVDPRHESIRIYARAGSAFGARVELSRRAGGVLRTPLMPGLSVSLDGVFRGVTASRRRT